MKNSYYFPHDYHARHDPKLERLRMELGPVGDGIYWDLVEMLYEEGGYLSLKHILAIAKAINTTEELVLKVVKESELFIVNNGKFYSESLLERLNHIKTKIRKARTSGKLGGLANAKRTLSERLVIKVKESKVKDIKSNAPQEIYLYYSKIIKAGAKEDAINSISKLLKTGITKDDLLGRIDAYKAKLIKDNIEPRFYIQANNFFGKAARYKDFEPVRKVEYSPPDPLCKACKGQGRLMNGEGQVIRCTCVKEK